MFRFLWNDVGHVWGFYSNLVTPIPWSKVSWYVDISNITKYPTSTAPHYWLASDHTSVMSLCTDRRAEMCQWYCIWGSAWCLSQTGLKITGQWSCVATAKMDQQFSLTGCYIWPVCVEPLIPPFWFYRRSMLLFMKLVYNSVCSLSPFQIPLHHRAPLVFIVPKAPTATLCTRTIPMLLWPPSASTRTSLWAAFLAVLHVVGHTMMPPSNLFSCCGTPGLPRRRAWSETWHVATCSMVAAASKLASFISVCVAFTSMYILGFWIKTFLEFAAAFGYLLRV